MKPETREWIDKAEDDYRAAVALNRQRARPLPDQVGFHCQQTAEKYLKAFLHEHNAAFAKIHDLAALLKLAIAVDVRLRDLRADARRLTEFAVDYRYPGMRADVDEADAAIQSMRAFRGAFRKRLMPTKSRKKKQA